MWSLHSFLSLPFTLPALPSISLPANIQRRFLSYVLKRALGRFVKAEGLDVERIQAQISQGWVEIERLDVNAEEINAMIPPSLPFSVTSGVVSTIAARVPFPNLWSDPLSLNVDSLHLDVSITPSSSISRSFSNHPSSTPQKGHDQGSHPSFPHDLASSFTSAADDFMHDELDAYEGAELDRSIRESLVLTQTDPFANDEVPGAFPGLPPSSPPAAGSLGSPPQVSVESTTVLASLVERILARLECKVKDIRVRLHYDDHEHAGTFELRIGQVRYADESASTDSEAPRSTVRAIRFSSMSLYFIPPQPKPQPAQPSARRTASRSSSSTSFSSSESDSTGDDEVGDMNATMYMSQGIADLRQSTMTTASGMSIYHSAISERVVEEEHESGGEHEHAIDQGLEPVLELPPMPERSRSATPTAAQSADIPPALPGETLLLSFGTDDIVFKATTTQPLPSTSVPATPDMTTPPTRPQPTRASTSFVNSQLPALDVELSVGTITVVVLPAQAATILAAAQAVSSSLSSFPKAPEPKESTSLIQPRFTGRVKLKAVYLSFICDLGAPTAQFSAAIAQYWSKPASTYLPAGHIRIRIEDVEAVYSTKGFVPAPDQTARTRAGGSRRLSTFGPQPPVITLTVNDFSIFEYLHTHSSETGANADEPPGGVFPVLVFDSNLLKQYDVPLGASSVSLAGSGQQRRPGTHTSVPIVHPNAPTFPEFDVVDWRNSGLHRKSAGVGGERAWRVKQKTRGILRGASPKIEDESSPAIYVHQVTSGTEAAVVELLPVHVFLDLSLVERLLPLLRSLAPIVHPAEKEPLPQVAFTPHEPAPRLSTHFVIDDLDARANALQSASARGQRSAGGAGTDLLVVKCPLMRLDVRCPAPPNRRGGWGDGAHLRSGIVTLDIHGLDAKVSQAGKGEQGKGRSMEPTGGAKVEWQKMILFFCKASEKRATAFLVVGPLAPEPGDSPDDPVLLPAIKIGTTTTPSTGITTQIVTCSIPSVQAKIRQPVVEGLQFFADDMTHWLDGAFGDGSAPRPRDDLKMIGSRFFGSKASSSASSSAEEEEEDAASKATLLRVVISEADVALHVPRAAAAAGTATVVPGVRAGTGTGPVPAMDVSERVLSLRVSDVDVKLESNTTGRQETAITLSAMDADFIDLGGLSPHRIFGRTTPLTLTAHSNAPLLFLRFSSLTNTAGTKETGIKISLSSFCAYITKDLEWFRELALFAKTPEGVFEDVVPSEVTKMSVIVSDGSVHVSAPGSGGAVVLVLGEVEVKAVVESEAEENEVEVYVGKANILAIDEVATAGGLQPGLPASFDAWKMAGYASLIDVSALDVHIIRNLIDDAFLLDVRKVKVRVTACADSLATFGAMAGDMANLVPKDKVEEKVKVRRPELDQSVDVFASIDSDAFNRAPDIVSGADMIDDDLPTNLDYLDRATGQLRIDPATGETLRSWETPEHGGRYGEGASSETVKVFSGAPFEMVENYWETLPVQKRDGETKVGKNRVRVQHCDVAIHLHDGYDWQRTRKTIEDEIKAVRRRLERIRQLLASGQKADESIERTATSTVLFNSVYIGLDQRDEMDSATLLAAINDELDDLGAGAETASQSSWQSFPEAAGGGVRQQQQQLAKKTRLHGRRLTRSKRPQIEITVQEVTAHLDLYEPSDETASRVHITVAHLEILDHIKTSTWKKFLTEMKSDSRGNVRETDADMVRIELVAVRPSLPSTEEENRLRVKVLPLRLHVDQDALDFLKRFFSFTPPPTPGLATAPPREPKPASAEPFFQRVEIFPIELKLDYKPKRVDYAALRQGKTIELMNFFHFDGAEMTLRHVTMSGVTGWTRLSTSLQDIWTPDVKANQLADVISGVAPIRSLVNVGSGVADLILLPIEQYRKDGRVARGVQRGTNSFVRSTAMEMMKLGARLATGTQVILERAETVLGGRFGTDVVGEVAGGGGATGGAGGVSAEGEGPWMGSGRREYDEDDSDDYEDYGVSAVGRGGGGGTGAGSAGALNDGTLRQLSRFADQPADVREGVQAAYASLSRNLNSAAQTILAVPMEVYERSTDANGQAGGPLRAVVRAVPIAVLKPMIGASEAVSKTLLGIRNSLDPETKRELGDKYK